MSAVDTVKVVIGKDDVVGNNVHSLVGLISALQAELEKIPEENRASAEVEIWAYDWEGSCVSYVREMTQAEKSARLAEIDRQRAFADSRMRDDWLRAVRMRYGLGRDEAIEFIRTNADANELHPDLRKQKIIDEGAAHD